MENAETYFRFFGYAPNANVEGVWTRPGNMLLATPPLHMTVVELIAPPGQTSTLHCGQGFVVKDLKSENLGHVGPFVAEDDAKAFLSSQGYWSSMFDPCLWQKGRATYLPLYDHEATIVPLHGWCR